VFWAANSARRAQFVCDATSLCLPENFFIGEKRKMKNAIVLHHFILNLFASAHTLDRKIYAESYSYKTLLVGVPTTASSQQMQQMRFFWLNVET